MDDINFPLQYMHNSELYDIQNRHAMGLVARADLVKTGEFYCDNKNRFKHEGSHTLNLRLGYETENYDIILWGKNLFDEEYYTYYTPYGQNELIADGDPRTFGVTINYRF